MEKSPKVEIINETTITSTSTTDLDGNCDKEVTKTVTNRVNLEVLSEDFYRDYFNIPRPNITIEWDIKERGEGGK